MDDGTDLGGIWREVQAALPVGWRLDRLRCAGAGLAIDLRSDEWIAVAVAPDGSELRYQAPSPAAALRGLPGMRWAESDTNAVPPSEG